MNKPNKTKPYVCPKCGSDNFSTEDYEFDGETMHEEVMCQDCGEVWDEYHTLTYRGYVYKGIDYDENGEIMH